MAVANPLIYKERSQFTAKTTCGIGVLAESTKLAFFGSFNRSAGAFIKRYLQQLEAYARGVPVPFGSRDLLMFKPFEELSSFFSDYSFFTICRHPVPRIFSAWVNFAFNEVTADPELYDHYGIRTALTVPAISTCFEHFITDLYNTAGPKLLSSRYWMSQKNKLLVEDIPYNEIVHLEDLPLFLQRLATGINIPNEFFLEEQFPIRKGPIPYHQNYISAYVLEKITEIYAEDFEYFGYDIDIPKVDVYEAPNKAYFEMTLSERTAFIEAQHDLKLQELQTARRLAAEAEQIERDKQRVIEEEQAYIKSILEEAEEV